MPCVLLPNVIAEQERIERETQAKRRAEADNVENRVIDWFLEKHKDNEDFAGHTRENYTCMTYWCYYHYIVDDVLNLPEGMRRFFDVDKYVLNQYNNWKAQGDDPVYIVADKYASDCEEDYVLLEDCGEFAPLWNGMLGKYFSGHPAKLEHFYIIQYTG